MIDPAKNIQCETYFLDLQIRCAKDIKKRLKDFATGPGYADNILTCKTGLEKRPEKYARLSEQDSQVILRLGEAYA
jgi:hypothetical protein